MIEYLYDAIRATAGADVDIITRITEDGESVDGVCLVLHVDDEHMIIVEGVQSGDAYSFKLPAEATKDLKGRYMYCFKREDEMLCFKQPIYFV